MKRRKQRESVGELAVAGAEALTEGPWGVLLFAAAAILIPVFGVVFDARRRARAAANRQPPLALDES